MDIALVKQAVGAFGGGFLVWTYFRYFHRYGAATKEYERKGYIFIKAPSWLIIICGCPRPGNELELMHTLGQIGGLFLSVIWLPMYWLGFIHSQRMNIYLFLCVGMFFMFMMIAPGVIALYRKIKHTRAND